MHLKSFSAHLITERFLSSMSSNMHNRLKKRNSPDYFNTNYCAEMKLVPIIMYYCLLQFDALKCFLGVHLHGRFLDNFNFFNVSPQIFQRNRKAHFTNCLETNFHNISIFSLRVIRRRIYN